MTGSEPQVILHGLWTGGLFHLWGERADAQSVMEPVARDCNPILSETASRHPRALSVDQLHAAAGELCGDGLLAAVAAESVLDLWLPCQADEPASGALVRNDDPTQTVEPPDPAGATDPQPVAWTLQPWQISTLTFAPAEALDLLASIRASGDASTGSSLRYWAQLAAYVVSGLSRQQFIPVLHESSDGSLTARWRLVGLASLSLRGRAPSNRRTRF